MTKKYRGNPALFDSDETKESLPYLEIKKDDLVVFDDTSHPHTRFGRRKLKNPELCRKYDAVIAHFSTKTWLDLLDIGKVNGMELIYTSDVTVEFPASYVLERKPKKVGVGRYSHTRRFGGIFDSVTSTFFVFWVDQGQDNFYKHIAG